MFLNFSEKFLNSVKKVFKFFLPPPEWQLAVWVVLGVFVGVGGYVYYISNASSYLSDDPKTCVNCHVMNPQYATWQRSSHYHAATCMDCHVPHDNVVNKYFFKMKDGLRHSKVFTLHQEPQVIRIKEEGARVVMDNCIRCHTPLLEDTALHASSYQGYLRGEGKLCWDCHREVPHGRTRSLSATPYSYSPEVPGGEPDWIKEMFLPKKDHQ